jgi:membrane fusion protein (multidrug efflux system)
MLIRSKSTLIMATVLLVAAATLGTGLLLFKQHTETTDDAYVAADFTLVAPKVAGLVEEVRVADNEVVSKGQILLILDDRDYRAALASAQADVDAARAEITDLDAQILRQPSLVAQAAAAMHADAAAMAFANANAVRYAKLSTDGSGTVQENQRATSQLGEAQAARERDAAMLESARLQLGVLKAGRAKAQATLAKTESQRDQAQLNLSYTVVRTPIDGIVGRRSVRPGSYYNAGVPMLAVVPAQEAFVIANFQENQLEHIRLNQPTLIAVDGYPRLGLHGHVDSLAPATDVAFAPIQPDNATGNFTKVVQRIPIKIVIDRGQPDTALLRVGMSVIPTIDVSGRMSSQADLARTHE